MRVAFIGKGGTGKSALAGTLCRILARRGHQVLALDADNVPGLAYSIGLEPTDDLLLSSAATFEEGKGYRMVISPAEAVERFALTGPDGVRFLQFGKPRGATTRDYQASATAFLEIVRSFDDPCWTVVTDLAAGTRQAYFGWTGIAQVVIAVVEPSASSLLTARRFGRLAAELESARLVGVANKVATEAQRGRIAGELDRIGIPYWAEVPADPIFGRAERQGRAPIETGPGSPAILALERIAERLVGENLGAATG